MKSCVLFWQPRIVMIVFFDHSWNFLKQFWTFFQIFFQFFFQIFFQIFIFFFEKIFFFTFFRGDFFAPKSGKKRAHVFKKRAHIEVKSDPHSDFTMRVVSPSILPQYEPFFWSISPFRKKRAHDFIPPFQERKTSEMITMCSRFHLTCQHAEVENDEMSCLFTEEAIDEIVKHWNREPQKYLGFDFFLLIFLKKWIFFEKNI